MKHTVSINNSQGKKITLKVTCNAIEYTYIEEYAGDITLPSSGNEGESEEGIFPTAHLANMWLYASYFRSNNPKQ